MAKMKVCLIDWVLRAAALLFIVTCLALSVLACWGVWWVIAS